MKYLKLFENYITVNGLNIEPLINSEKFLKFFTGSVMYDKNNIPIIFYHGSEYDFNEFNSEKIGTSTDAGWLGRGFYFYQDPHEASHYGKTKAYFLNIKNPYYATDEENEYLMDMNDRETSEEFSDNLISQGYDSVHYNGNLRGETVVFDKSQIFYIENN